MAAYICLNCERIEGRCDEDCCSNPDLFCINDMPGEICRLRIALEESRADKFFFAVIGSALSAFLCLVCLLAWENRVTIVQVLS